MKGHHTLFLLLLLPTPLWLSPGIFVWNLRNLHENSFAKPDLGFTNKAGLGCVLWQVFSQKFPAASVTVPNPLPINLALYSLALYLHWTQRMELSKRSSPRFTFLCTTVRKGLTGITKSTNSLSSHCCKDWLYLLLHYRHNFCLQLFAST